MKYGKDSYKKNNQRFLSFFIAFAMIFSMIIQVAFPIVGFAAEDQTNEVQQVNEVQLNEIEVSEDKASDDETSEDEISEVKANKVEKNEVETSEVQENQIKTNEVEVSEVTEESDFVFADGVITEYNGSETHLLIPEKIDGQAVVEIGDSVFRNKGLNSVKLPDTLEKVGSRAFQGNNLKSITFPNSLQIIEKMVFASNQLETVNFPASLKIIGEGAFLANNISTVNLNEGLEKIEDNAFTKAPIEEVVIPDSVKHIGMRAFSNGGVLHTVDLGEGVEYIGKYAFEKNVLTSIIIPDSVTNIDDAAFWENRISEVRLGSGVERLGNQVFASNFLDSLTIPNGLNLMAYHTLKDNPGLDGDRSFKLNLEEPVNDLNEIQLQAFYEHYPSSTTELVGIDWIETEEEENGFTKYIGHFQNFTEVDGNPEHPEVGWANEYLAMMEFVAFVAQEPVEEDWLPKHFTFEGTKLTGFSELGQVKHEVNKNLVIPRETIDGQVVDTIGDRAFNSEDYYQEHAEIRSLVLPDTIKEIEIMAFRNQDIVDLYLPDSVEVLGNGAFAANRDLETLRLSNNLKVIPQGCFSFNKIQKLVIPEGVTEIGGSAFSENNLLSDLTLPSTLLKIKSRAFWNAGMSHLTIPGNVKEIEFDAFIGGQLTSVTLEEGIEIIGRRAFKRNNLSEVIIPKSVTSIDRTTFDRNPSIDVKYVSLLEILEEAESLNLEGKTQSSIAALQKAIEKGEELHQVPYPQIADANEVLMEIREAIDGLVDIDPDNPEEPVDPDPEDPEDPEEPIEIWATEHFEYDGTTLIGFSESGEVKFKDNKNLVIPEKNTEGETIIAIGLGAFMSDTGTADKDKIKSLQLPNTIEKIGERAFAGNLIKSLEIPSSVKSIDEGAFLLNQMENLVINEGLESIGRHSFTNNELKELVIPSSVRELGQRAFFNNQISKLTFLPGIETIGAQAFENNRIKELELPETLKSLDLGAFVYNSIEEIKLPDGLEIVGPKSFGVNSMESVTFPESVKFFCPNAFRKNAGFDSGEFKIFIDKIVEIDEDIEESTLKEVLNEEIKVRAAVFEGLLEEEKHIIDLRSWERIGVEDGYLIYRGKFETIPEEIKACGLGSSCENIVENMEMTSLIVKVRLLGELLDPEKPLIEDWSFRHFTFDGTSVTGFSQVGLNKYAEDKDVIIPEKTPYGQIVDSIGDRAFNLDSSGEDGIKSLTLPDTIKSIGEMAFRNNNLEDLILPDSVETIGSKAFEGNNIGEVIIPKNVTALDGTAFDDNPNIDVKYASLLETLEEAKNINKEGKTESSIAALQEAIAKGEDLHKLAFPQLSEVNTAISQIRESINGLEDKVIDPEEPTDPEDPEEPIDPVDPEEPQDPEVPVDPEDPVVDLEDPESPKKPEESKETSETKDPKKSTGKLPKTGSSVFLPLISLFGVALAGVGLRIRKK